MEDRDFALEQGILPLHETKGKIREQFLRLGELAEISEKQLHKMLDNLTSHSDEVKALIQRSYLSERTKRNYEQAYLTRLNKLMRE
jgi:serine/threonine-protein kinase HipA